MASGIISLDSGNELIHILERGGEMMDYFVSRRVVDGCSKILEQMKTSLKVASGKQGSIFILGDDQIEYAVKKSVNDMYIIDSQEYPNRRPIQVKDLWNMYINTFPPEEQLPKEVFVMVNGGNEHKIVNQHDLFFMISKDQNSWPCKTGLPLEVKKFYLDERGNKHYKGHFLYPKGSYLCGNESYSEYAIGMMCSSAVNKGRCVNFLKMAGFSMCGNVKDDNIRLYDYTFMERVHNDLKLIDTRDDLSIEMVDGVLIQTIFAISYMQRVYGIQHNDLHLGNVMYLDLKKTKNDVYFRSHNLNTADYFAYNIDGEYIYFKNTGIIVKIIDYGFAMKYSSPIVGRRDVAEGGFKEFPSWRDDFYDLFVFMTGYGTTFNTDLVLKTFIRMMDPYSAFKDKTTDTLKDQLDNLFDRVKRLYTQGEEGDWRPNFTGLSKHPWEYLLDKDIIGNYMEPPPEGSKIALLGVLNKTDYHKDFFQDDKPLHLFTRHSLA